MNKIFHPADERGKNDLGWLKANFSFSFGPYYNPNRISFGVLRVLNDDEIAGGHGFGSHPHDNMEIITIVLSGALKHEDSLGFTQIVKAGDVQVMSTGTGVMHAEHNPLAAESTNSLQIWLYPKEMNIQPHYAQKSFANEFGLNKLVTVVSPDKQGEALWINQDAWFSIGEYEENYTIDYAITQEGNGAYIFLLDGSIDIDGITLNKRDALGVYDTSSFTIHTKVHSRFLIMDIPM